jgi:hypothetical protein
MLFSANVRTILNKPVWLRLATVALVAVWLDSLARIPFAGVPSGLSPDPPSVPAPALASLIQECERLRLPETVDFISAQDVPLESLVPRLKAAQTLSAWPSDCLNRSLGATWAVASHDWFTSDRPTDALRVLLASLNPMLRSGEAPADMRLQGQCMGRIQELLAERRAQVTSGQIKKLQETVETLPSVQATVQKAYRRWTYEWASKQKNPRYTAQMLAEMDLLVGPPLLQAIERHDSATFLRLCVDERPLVRNDPVMVDLLSDLLQLWFSVQERNDQARVLVVLLRWKSNPQQAPNSPFDDVHGRFTPYDATVWSEGINGKDDHGSEAPWMGSHAWMPAPMRETFSRRQLQADEVYRVGLR